MSVAFLHPFFDEMLRRGTSRSELATRINLPEASLFDPRVMVPANGVYAFLSWVTESTGDPLVCARIGQRMASGAWAPLVPVMHSARTVGEFFQKFSLMSSKQGRAAAYRLEVEGEVALWRLVRAKGASEDAAFADAVATGFFVALLKSAAKEKWEPARIIAILSDTKLVSRELLPSTSLLSGQTGLILRFPSTFLGLEMPTTSLSDDLPVISMTVAQKTTLAERVRHLIEQRISDPSLGVKSVAMGLGLASWRLQSLLKDDGTSVASIKEDVRRKRAVELIVESSESVGSIAARLGYTNDSNFTRAFGRWTGKSPRDYRKAREAVVVADSTD